MILSYYTFLNDFNSTFFNLPLPASEKLNYLVILALEVFYMTLFIFFVVSLVLLETILVYIFYQFKQEASLSFYFYHFTIHLIYFFVIYISTIKVIQIIVYVLGYEEMLYSDTFVSFEVNKCFLIIILLLILIYFFYNDSKVFNFFYISKKKKKLNTLTSIFFLQPNKISNTIKKKYSSFLLNPENKSKILEIESDIMNLRLNELIDSDGSILFQTNEQNIFDWLISIRLEILKLFLSKHYKVDIKDIIVKENTIQNRYEFFDVNKNILLFFVYFFYRKQFEISVNNINYNIYCLYHLFDFYSLLSFNCVFYRCIYIYFDNSNNSFLFDTEIDNSIFDQLVLLDIKNTPHKNDIFLYTSLLNAISNLINSKLIYISSDVKTDFYFRLENKNPFRLTRKYSTKIKKSTSDSMDLDFELFYLNYQLNKEINNKQEILFLSNEDLIFEFLTSKLINYCKSFIIHYYDYNRHWGDDIIEVVTPDNIIVKNKDYKLYEFYLDSDPDNLLYYIYLIDNNIINLSLDSSVYKIYCLYFFLDKFGCFSNFNNILYKCVYIYYNIKTNSYSFSKEVDNSLFDKLIDESEEHPIHKRNLSLYKSLLNSIFNLSNYNMITIPNCYSHFFLTNLKSIKKKNNTIDSNIKRKFHTFTIYYFKYNNNLLGKSNKLLDSIKNVQKNHLFIDDFLKNENKMYGLIKLKYLKLDELDYFFHTDLRDSSFYNHNWLLLHNNIKLVDEDGNLREGYIMTTCTSHKLTGQISTNLKFLCPSFWKDNSRLYYYIYFFENNSDFKDLKVKFKKDSNLKFEFVYNYLVTALSKDSTEIRCSKSNKKLFTKDNLKYSNLEYSKYSDKITDLNSLYCTKWGIYCFKSTILPIFSETKVTDLNKDNNSENHYDDSDIKLD